MKLNIFRPAVKLINLSALAAEVHRADIPCPERYSHPTLRRV